MHMLTTLAATAVAFGLTLQQLAGAALFVLGLLFVASLVLQQGQWHGFTITLREDVSARIRVGIGVVLILAGMVVAFLPPIGPGSASAGSPESTFTATAAGLTPTPEVKRLNEPIPCVPGGGSLCAYYTIGVVLNSVTVDRAAGHMLWQFTITNDSNRGFSDMNFQQLQLEDPTGQTYGGSGQAQDMWNLAPGGSTVETPTFNFLPTPGVAYKLLLDIGPEWPCQTETFTF
jgi:hypothetical protein